MLQNKLVLKPPRSFALRARSIPRWDGRESNPRHHELQSCALPLSYRPNNLEELIKLLNLFRKNCESEIGQILQDVVSSCEDKPCSLASVYACGFGTCTSEVANVKTNQVYLEHSKLFRVRRFIKSHNTNFPQGSSRVMGCVVSVAELCLATARFHESLLRR